MFEVSHLYLHVPFCIHICPYCDFATFPFKKGGQRAFVEAIESEITFRKLSDNTQLSTIYLGGGTPGALSRTHLKKLLSILNSSYKKEKLYEFTIEINPKSMTEKKLELLGECGVNRLSIGIQSFNDDELKLLGRYHTANDAKKMVQTCKRIGFSNISIDLMFSLPGQSFTTWNENLKKAIDLDPNHISTYSLTYEGNTPFHQNYIRGNFIKSEEKDAKFYDLSMDILQKNDFNQYEISNFAKSGFESKHNTAYWDGKDFLGLGPSSCFTVNKNRYQNVSNFKHYLQLLKNGKDPKILIEELTNKKINSEKILLGLRTKKGIDISLLQKSEDSIRILQEGNLAKLDNNRIILTKKGFLKADSIALLLLENL